jgi:hypothetical protein
MSHAELYIPVENITTFSTYTTNMFNVLLWEWCGAITTIQADPTNLCLSFPSLSTRDGFVNSFNERVEEPNQLRFDDK